MKEINNVVYPDFPQWRQKKPDIFDKIKNENGYHQTLNKVILSNENENTNGCMFCNFTYWAKEP